MRRPEGIGWSRASMGLAAALLLCPLVRAAEGVRFRLVGGVYAVVPAFVDGQGPFEFLLDTGSNANAVDLELARHLGLRPIDQVLLVGPGSERVVPRARLASLAFGPQSFEGLEVVCSDLGGIRRLDPSIRGVLGQGFLSRVNYLLSYRNRRIEFVDPEGSTPSWRGTPVPFLVEEGRMLVTAEGARAPSRRLVLDSAASGVVLFGGEPAYRGSDVETDGGTVAARTGLGDVQLRSATMRQLVIGGQAFHDLPVLLAPHPSGTERRTEDGLLPTSLFRDVYVDNHRRYVVLNPKR